MLALITGTMVATSSLTRLKSCASSVPSRPLASTMRSGASTCSRTLALRLISPSTPLSSSPTDVSWVSGFFVSRFFLFYSFFPLLFSYFIFRVYILLSYKKYTSKAGKNFFFIIINIYIYFFTFHIYIFFTFFIFIFRVYILCCPTWKHTPKAGKKLFIIIINIFCPCFHISSLDYIFFVILYKTTF